MNALPQPGSGTTNLDLFVLILRWAGVLAAVVQIAIEPLMDNMLSVLLVLGSSLVVLEYLRITRTPVQYPVSSLALLGLCLMTQYVSLLVQTAYWKPLVYMLKAPVETFLMLGAVQVLAVLSHWLYRHGWPFQAAREFIADRVLAPIGAFHVPSPGSIWTMAFFGALSLLAGNQEMGNVGGKIFEAMGFFAWLPFMIPIYYKKYGDRYCSRNTQYVTLALYVLLLIAIGVARNARQIMLIGPMQAAFMFFLMSLQSPKPVDKAVYRKLAIFAVVGVIGLQLIGDLATAMVVVREKNSRLPYDERIAETVATLADRTRLELYRDKALAEARNAVYDEVYISNALLGRFSETKFHDNMMFLSSRLSDAGRDEVRHMLMDRVLVILPQNILRKFGVSINKDRYSFSGGDIYRYINGDGYALGSFSTGSIWVDVLSLSQIASPFIVVFICLLCFVILDGFSRRQPDILNVSVVVLCSLWAVYANGIGGESIAHKILFLFRELPQKTVMFLAMYWALRLVTRRATRIDGVDVPLKPDTF